MRYEPKSPFPGDGLDTTEPYEGLIIEVMGQLQATLLFPGPDDVCISIVRVGEPPAKISTRFIEVLRLAFDDCAVDIGESIGQDLTDVQAEQIADFVLRHRDRPKLVVHCYAGISRSRSVAAAIAWVLRLPFKFTVLNRPVYVRVGRALEKKLHAR